MVSIPDLGERKVVMTKTQTRRGPRLDGAAGLPPPGVAVANGEVSMGTKPDAEFRLGRVKVVLQKKEGEGEAAYMIEFRRLYKENGQWRTTDSFSKEDMPLIETLADWAFFHCHKHAGCSAE